MDKIIELLTVHTYIENEVMYPRVRELVPELEDDVLESYEEHHVADVLVMELAAMKPEDERFTAKTTVLIENVRHHIEEEEDEWFPKVREGLGRKVLTRSGPRWRRPQDGPAAPLAAQRAEEDDRRRHLLTRSACSPLARAVGPRAPGPPPCEVVGGPARRLRPGGDARRDRARPARSDVAGELAHPGLQRGEVGVALLARHRAVALEVAARGQHVDREVGPAGQRAEVVEAVAERRPAAGRVAKRRRPRRSPGRGPPW